MIGDWAVSFPKKLVNPLEGRLRKIFEGKEGFKLAQKFLKESMELK